MNQGGLNVRRARSVPALALAALLSPMMARAQSTTPAAPPAAEQPAAASTWHPTITIGGYLQGEFDGGAQGDSRFPSSNRFFLRRARLTAGGEALPSLVYRVQADFAGGLGSSSGVSASLTDGYIEWTEYEAAHVRVGQFKAPFGREWLVPSTHLLTVERTLASDRLTLNRQIGLSLLGRAGNRATYMAGMFNGSGRNTTVNEDGHFLYVLRGTVRPWVDVRGATIDIGANTYWSREEGLSMSKDFGLDSTPESPAADSLFTGTRRGLGVDTHVERGGLQLDAELLHARFDQDGAAVVTSRGWYIQPAAFVRERVVQVVGRYEWFRPDTSIAGNETTTWLAGVNYFARGTSAKLMADYLWVTDAQRPDDAHAKVLVQLQVAF